MVNFPELVLRKVGTQTAYFQTLETMPVWYLFIVFAPGIFAWAAATFVLIERPALVWGSRWIAARRQGVAAQDITEPPAWPIRLAISVDHARHWLARVWQPAIRAIAPVAAAALFVLVSASALRWTFGIPPATVAAATSQPGKPAADTRCEVEIGPKLCPGMPGFEPARTQRIFADNWDGSGNNLTRCIRRAREFYSACNAGETVSARFYVDGKVVQSRSHP